MHILEKLDKIINSVVQKLEKCRKKHDLLLLKSEFLGQNSEIKYLEKDIKNFTIDEKKTVGKKIQQTIENIESLIEEHQKKLVKNEEIDVFLPVRKISGFRHIISHTAAEVKSILLQMGFVFEESPEIETEFMNFTALNVDEKHPCRDDHQSFFLENGKILRTHTSSIQNYLLKQNPSNFKCFTIGRTFRRDLDRTHVPMFHQIEGLCVSPSANVSSLFYTLKTFLANFFMVKNPEIRIRPSFFPFTRPSYEIDMKIGTKWLEILGGGIIHPNVFAFADRKPELGFAFGCGLERIAMIKHKIFDIRKVYSENAAHIQQIGSRL